jgi:GNAT superfamily N-acetyltransferase
MWEKLNALHLADSVHFKDHFAAFTFEQRAEKFLLMSGKDVLIEIAVNENGEPVGYCVSTAEGGAGELDSLFIEEHCRGRGIGETLVRRSLEWMKGKNCARIMAAVAHGHESVLPFYERFGFYPRFTYLQHRE